MNHGGQQPYGQGQYGQAPPGQSPYSQQQGPPPGQTGGAATTPPSVFKRVLEQAVQQNRLEAFYPPGSPDLQRIADKAPTQIDALCRDWQVPKELGIDLVRLGLYDIILYIDNSGSMEFEEDGRRITELNDVLRRVAYASTFFDEDGITVRFMNGNPGQDGMDNVRNADEVQRLVSGIQFRGLTPFGEMLERKVFIPLVMPRLQRLASGQMRPGQVKPILVICLTDGAPTDNPPTRLYDVIRAVKDAVSRLGNGISPKSLALQFAQIGNDQLAMQFLSALDKHPAVGSMVDCTSGFEYEQAEMERNMGINLTRSEWLVKLMLGAIDSSFDDKDEGDPQQTQAGGPQGNPYQ